MCRKSLKRVNHVAAEKFWMGPAFCIPELSLLPAILTVVSSSNSTALPVIKPASGLYVFCPVMSLHINSNIRSDSLTKLAIVHIKSTRLEKSLTASLLSPSTTKQPTPWHTMAKLSNSNLNHSSSIRRSSSASSRGSMTSTGSTTAVRASCYTVDACTAALSGMHYSTTGAGGVEWFP